MILVRIIARLCKDLIVYLIIMFKLIVKLRRPMGDVVYGSNNLLKCKLSKTFLQ